ncbi:MAG: Shedu immune nuclease family protein [Enhygromyxa sp.]
MDDDSYSTSSTSRSTAIVEDRVLSQGSTTRKLLRAQIHDNPREPDATVGITLVHQRKRPKGAWEDLPGRPLSALEAGEAARFTLSSTDTLRLWRELEALYEIYEQRGVPRGKQRLVVVPEEQAVRTDRRRAAALRELLADEDAEALLAELLSSAPDLATRLGQLAGQRQRVAGLRRFDVMLGGEHPEQAWQEFLAANTWIFGYGLNYQILRTIQEQPNYGGAAVDRRGGRRGDYLQATEGAVRFTVLVEIKSPQTRLLRGEYRNGAYGASSELAGAISQVQTNCHVWETEGARNLRNQGALAGALTVRPKGILVIGHGSQLASHDQKLAFELLRRNTLDPEIITFDELHARARFIVAEREGDQGKKRSGAASLAGK